MAADQAAFADLVQDALAHLYDQVSLQQHPLATLFAAGPSEVVRGQTLHRLLLEAISQLKPTRGVPEFTGTWRKYQYFVLRYVEGRPALAAAEELAISERQSRRYHHEALEAVTSVLWGMYEAQASSLETVRDSSDERRATEQDQRWSSLLKEEVARLGSQSGDSSTVLPDVIENVVSAMVNLARSQGVEVRVSVENDLPLVGADRIAVRQALFSVLTYAIRRSTDAAITLHVARGRSPGYLEVQISWPEVRPDESRPSSGPSSGSGSGEEGDEEITAARQILADVHGELEVADAGPGYRCLCLELPCLCPATVLVIDDNPDIVRLFRRYLGGRSYQVLSANSGAGALEIVRRSPPGAITLDVMMPNQDGWEILQLLQNLPETRDVPVIVCSVLRERDLALSLGATDFLAKPVTRQELLLVLDLYLADRQARRTPPAGDARFAPPRAPRAE